MTNVTITTQDPCPVNEIFKRIAYIFFFGCTPIIITGIILNILTLLVIPRLKNKVIALVLIQALAWADLLYLGVNFGYLSIRYIVEYIIKGDWIFKVNGTRVNPLLFYILLPLRNASLIIRNYMVILITLDRLVCILAPFWYRANVTKSRLMYCCASICVVGFTVGSIWYIGNGWVPDDSPCAEPGAWRIYSAHDWIFTVSFYSLAVMTAFVPMIIITLSNLILWIKIILSGKQRSKLSADKDHDSGQRKATVMVLAMSLTFIICEFPKATDRALRTAGVVLSDSTYHTLRDFLGQTFHVLNSTLNFAAYVISNRSFRQTFMTMCGWNKGDEKKQVEK